MIDSPEGGVEVDQKGKSEHCQVSECSCGIGTVNDRAWCNNIKPTYPVFMNESFFVKSSYIRDSIGNNLSTKLSNTLSSFSRRAQEAAKDFLAGVNFN